MTGGEAPPRILVIGVFLAACLWTQVFAIVAPMPTGCSDDSSCEEFAVCIDPDCTCIDGFTLNSTSDLCDVSTPCTTGKECEQVCAVVNGTDTCFCSRDYFLGGDGESCLQARSLFVTFHLDVAFNQEFLNESSYAFNDLNYRIGQAADEIFGSIDFEFGYFLSAQFEGLSSFTTPDGQEVVQYNASLTFGKPITEVTLFVVASVMSDAHEQAGGVFGSSNISFVESMYIYRSTSDATNGISAINWCDFFSDIGYRVCGLQECQPFLGFITCQPRQCLSNSGLDFTTTYCENCQNSTSSRNSELFCFSSNAEAPRQVDVEMQIEGGVNTCSILEDLNPDNYMRNITYFVRSLFLNKQMEDGLRGICQSEESCENINAEVKQEYGEMVCKESQACKEDNHDICFDNVINFVITFNRTEDTVLVDAADNRTRPVEQAILQVLHFMYEYVNPNVRRSLVKYHSRFLTTSANISITEAVENKVFVTLHLNVPFNDQFLNYSSEELEELNDRMGRTANEVFGFLLWTSGFVQADFEGLQLYSRSPVEQLVQYNASLTFDEPIGSNVIFVIASVMAGSHESIGGSFGGSNITFVDAMYIYRSRNDALARISALDWCEFFIGFPVCGLDQCQPYEGFILCHPRQCSNGSGLSLTSLDCENCQPSTSSQSSELFCFSSNMEAPKKVDVKIWMQLGSNTCSFIEHVDAHTWMRNAAYFLRSLFLDRQNDIGLSGICQPEETCENINIYIEEDNGEIECKPGPTCKEEDAEECFDGRTNITITADYVDDKVFFDTDSNKTRLVEEVILQILYFMYDYTSNEVRRSLASYRALFLTTTARINVTESDDRSNNETLEACDVGFYFDGINCTACGNGLTTFSRGARHANQCIAQCPANEGFSFDFDPPQCRPCPLDQSSNATEQFCYYIQNQAGNFLDIFVDLPTTIPDCRIIVPSAENLIGNPDREATEYVRNIFKDAYSGICETDTCGNILVTLQQDAEGNYICTPNCGGAPNCSSFSVNYSLTGYNIQDKISPRNGRQKQRRALEVVLQTLYFLRHPSNAYEEDMGVPMSVFPPSSVDVTQVADFNTRRIVSRFNLQTKFPEDQLGRMAFSGYATEQATEALMEISSFAYSDFFEIRPYRDNNRNYIQVEMSFYFKERATQSIAEDVARILAASHQRNSGHLGTSGVSLIGPVALYQADSRNNITKVFELCPVFGSWCLIGEVCQQSDLYIECVTDIPSGNTTQRAFLPWGLSAGDKVVINQEANEFDNWLTISDPIVFDEPVPLGSQPFKVAHVLINGVITFGARKYAWWPNLQFAYSTGKSLLAPFWSSTNPQSGLKAYYQLYEDGIDVPGQGVDRKSLVLNKASQEVNEYEGSDSFEATTVLVVTWKDVEPYRWYTYYCTNPGFENSTYYEQYCTNKETATFQSVFITDGFSSYAMVTFLKGAQKWTFLQYFPVAVGHVSSLGVTDLGVTNSPVATRLDTIVGNTGRDGTWIDKVGQMENPVRQCSKFYQRNRHLINNTKFQQDVAGMLQCPCNLGQLARQWWFVDWKHDLYNQDTVIVCYALSPRAKDTDRLRDNSLNNLCCYRFKFPAADATWREWIDAWRNSSYIGYRDPEGSHILTQSPWFWSSDPRLYRSEDADPKRTCCMFAGVDSCEKYNLVRPDITCTNEVEFLAGMAFADPHIKTVDGFDYTLNGLGEYILLQIDSIIFMFQGRTQRAMTGSGELSDATVFSAFAAEENSNGHFQVELNHEHTGMDIQVNNDDITLDFYGNENYQRDFTTLQVSRDNNNNRVTVVVTFPSGISISIYVGQENLEFEVQVPNTYAGQGKGFMGNANNNPNDDFVIPSGETLPADQTTTERNIFFNFGKRCEVSDETTIFKYIDGESSATYRNETFVPFFIEDASPSDLSTAQSNCQNDRACVYDFLATGNQGFADHSRNSNEQADSVQIIITNRLPSVRVNPSSLNAARRWVVYHGQSSTIQFTATDADGDAFTFELDGNFPGVEIDANTGIVTFIPNIDSPVRVGVRATDERGGVSAIEYATVIACSMCSSNGTCDPSNLRDEREGGLFLLATCICNEGYSGVECEEDFDACVDNPCAVGQTCTDLTPQQQNNSPRGFVCGACPEGFIDLGGICSDVNECLNMTHPVCPPMATCQNTQGSFRCQCDSGYRADGAGECEDINECNERTHSCEQICMNTMGGYNCSCGSGSVLSANDRTCDLEPQHTQSCQVANCEQVCIVEGMVALCSCRAGFDVDPDNETACIDVDECTSGRACSQKCSNSRGGFSCSCFVGYFMENDLVTCSKCEAPYYGNNCEEVCVCNGRGRCDHARGCVCDMGWTGAQCDVNINECLEDDPCPRDQVCEDTRGNYTCLCRPGFEMVDGQCKDIDECASINTHLCNVLLEDCVNTIGENDCVCKRGYARNSTNLCHDIDECLTGSHDCEQICENNVGGFNCRCYNGFDLNSNRKTCRRVRDVCASSGLACDTDCTVNVNTNMAHCICNAGYTLLGIETCIDIDECSIDRLNLCEEKESCNNTVGGYTCSCKPGFQLDNDNRACVACPVGTWGENCANNCTCSKDGTDRCDARTGCVCKSGFRGEECEEDIDECTTGITSCPEGKECINVRGGASCECLKGYVENQNGGCIDIDECTGSSICRQICINTPGSFTCACNVGYSYNSTSEECTDVDECSLQTSGCEIGCVNTNGGFQCSCPDGLRLSPDGVSCIVSTECTVKQCFDRCASVQGVETCFCPRGMEVDSMNDTVCLDVDLCQGSQCSDTCEESDDNTSFLCTCPSGMILGSNGIDCEECPDGTYGNECSQTCSCIGSNTESCSKVNGSCECVDGFTGTFCENDINECLQAVMCPANSQCENIPGSFICKCESGYSRDNSNCIECDDNRFGEECNNNCICDLSTSTCDNVNGSCYCDNGWTGARCDEDINECNDINNACAMLNLANLICVNREGSFECGCDVGYSDMGGNCVDIDECNSGVTNRCDQVCNNSVGSFTCSCNSGYTVSQSDPFVCDDIDECTMNTDNCTQVCTNNNGGYTCGCNSGFLTDPNEATACYLADVIGFETTLDYNISSYNLNVPAEYQQVVDLIFNPILEKLQQRLNGIRQFVINSLRQGSVIINATTFIDANVDTESATNMVEALILLAQTGVVINGINTQATVVLGGTTVTPTTSKCVLLELIEACASGSFCTLDSDGKAYCKERDSDDSDDIPLIVGLSVGIPAIVIIAALVAVVFYIKSKTPASGRVGQDRHYSGVGRPPSTVSNTSGPKLAFHNESPSLNGSKIKLQDPLNANDSTALNP